MKQVSIIALIFLISCNNNDVNPVEVYPVEIAPYVDMFKKEALSRGYNLDLKNLKIYLLDSVPKNYYEAYYEPSEHAIYFRKNGFNFQSTREEVIMHELGHAILKREHRFDRFGNEVMKSVMGCPCDTPVSGWTNKDHQVRRKYYYDELFNPSTPTPDWAM